MQRTTIGEQLQAKMGDRGHSGQYLMTMTLKPELKDNPSEIIWTLLSHAQTAANAIDSAIEHNTGCEQRFLSRLQEDLTLLALFTGDKTYIDLANEAYRNLWTVLGEQWAATA